MSAEALPSETGLTTGRALARRTRILSFGGRRHIFALEEPFWTSLEQMAARQSVKLSQLISMVLAEHAGENQTSLLRAAVVRWLLDECDRHYAILLSSIRGILSAIPAPAVAMTDKQQVIAQNLPFARLLDERLQSEGDTNPELTLRLNVPPARLIALLTVDPHRAIGVPFTLRSSIRKISGIMNTSVIDPTGEKPVFMCVVRSVEGVN
ncbi:ribbon-helix-helix domain-containing protein [Bosea vaviloviae]|uniref:Ribbon-helix-helix domain-containing protein n=1 Tax=Bosea vaviloviae TaxID=1526658 RepID=A0A1D7U1N0_9HYPH|nr:ribbon-helix-helix domain-containing protein [Bosea vaviloviae]AOO81283.1 hypothetical protein BHK69_13160 [Bosea vaviloviae]